MLSLYLHFPFCKRKCSYCDFCSGVGDRAAMEGYVRALRAEIALQAAAYSAMPVDTVYLGGGTPSVMPAEAMRETLAVLRNRFTILPDAEWSSEANPGTLTDPWLDVLTEAGMNRLSLGVQAVQPQLLHAVEAVNEAQKGHLFELMTRHYGSADALRGKTVALWGLAFKPNTDDMREASSRRLLQQLWDVGANVRAYDPEAIDETRRIFGERAGLILCEASGDALRGADALVVVTEWKQFRSQDFRQLQATLGDAVVFDGRNLYEPAEVEAAGLAYYGIGRGRSVHAK